MVLTVAKSDCIHNANRFYTVVLVTKSFWKSPSYFFSFVFAMGAAESTQYSNYDIFQKDNSFYSPFEWELHHAKSKADGSLASIFRTSVKSATSANAYDIQ